MLSPDRTAGSLPQQLLQTLSRPGGTDVSWGAERDDREVPARDAALREAVVEFTRDEFDPRERGGR